jgi:hypothetical protein
VARAGIDQRARGIQGGARHLFDRVAADDAQLAGPGGIGHHGLAEGAGRAGQALQFHQHRFQRIMRGLAIRQARRSFRWNARQ